MSLVHRAVVLMALAGCYSPSYASCQIQCTTSCPNRLECDSELHLCRPPGTTCSGSGVGTDGGDPGPGDAAALGCMRVVAAESADDVRIMNVMLNPMVAAGNFVTVSISGNSPGSDAILLVEDFGGTMFTKAVERTITGTTTTTSAIYYVSAAPASMQTIEITWGTAVPQVVAVNAWHCASTPTLLTMASTSIGSTAATADTGALALAKPALVVANLAETTAMLPSLQTAGFIGIDPQSFSDAGGRATGVGAWANAGAGSADVTFNSASGTQAVGTAAAFSF
jgi:hypothetical protein